MHTTHRPARRLAARALTAIAVCSMCTTAIAPAVTAERAAATASHPAGSKRAVVTGAASDPDDVDGRLDIQRVRDRVVQIDRTHYLIGYRVRTYTPFATKRLDGRWRDFDLELDRDGAPGAERAVVVVDDDGLLEAHIISTATRRVLATVSATRPNDHAVDITGPRRLLGARSYFWTSNWHADGSPRCGDGDGFPITCQDSVPDDGWLRLDRPAWPDLG